MRTFPFVSTVALAVAGCGGGETPPPTDSAQVTRDLGAIVEAATSAIDSEATALGLGLHSGPNRIRGETLDSLQGTADDDDVKPRYRALPDRSGVSRAIATDSSTPFPGETLDSNRFAGWMHYSAILIERAVLVLDDPAERDLDETFIVSVGTASNSDPANGGASWHGVMAGFDLTEESSASRVEGLSRISVADFSDPAIDVSFTGIRNQVTGRRMPDMAWSDLALSGGTFAGTDLKGQFYGPDHEEVGGTFFRNNVAGAFGARR